MTEYILNKFEHSMNWYEHGLTIFQRGFAMIMNNHGHFNGIASEQQKLFDLRLAFSFRLIRQNLIKFDFHFIFLLN